MNWLGWLFCETAFRGWDWLGDRAEGGVADRIFGKLYRIGNWFYKKGGPA